jgi:hypothetical protein
MQDFWMTDQLWLSGAPPSVLLQAASAGDRQLVCGATTPVGLREGQRKCAGVLVVTHADL